MPPTMYTRIMSGTKPDVIFPIAWIPPSNTAPTRINMKIPDTHGSIWNESSSPVAIALAWVKLPIPKLAIIAAMVKNQPKNAPKPLGIPLVRYRIGPPDIVPWLSVSRNRTPRKASEYFDAIPTRPVIHIHTNAPGPPTEIAVATPTILPTPTVAARAVVNAWYCVMSPSPPSSSRSSSPSRKAEKILRNCTARRR